MKLSKVKIVIAAIVFPIAVVFTRSKETGDAPLVNTTVGMIRGVRAEDGSAKFMGIPYAIVDQENPFRAAMPSPVFDDVFNAINDSAMCPQLGGQAITLECLHLHVHVPPTIEDKPLPVFVYIHGGAFTSGGSGLGSSNFLIRKNVIFVSFNYRLGAYGFMCLHTAEVPGNQGLKDQLLALRWIKNNIEAFGGNADSITLAGDSAVGMSVDSQLLFADDGLFHRALILSGTSLTPTAYPEPDVDAALKIASQLGFETANTSEAVTFLSNQDPIQVLIAAQATQILFRPCAEKEFPDVERFATSHPVSAPMTRARDIPLIVGYTEDEWLLPYLFMPAHAFETLDIFNESIRFGFNLGDQHGTMESFARQFYLADEPMSINVRRSIIDFDSDFRFNHPTQRSIGKYLAFGGVTYHYVFTYIGGRNMQRIMFNITEGGATHSDDLGYFMDMPHMRDLPTTPDDDLMVKRITTLWTNFAKYGNPTPAPTELLPIQWLPVTRDRLNYLNLNLGLELLTRPFHQRLSFWDLFYDINREYMRGYTNDTVFNDVPIW